MKSSIPITRLLPLILFLVLGNIVMLSAQKEKEKQIDSLKNAIVQAQGDEKVSLLVSLFSLVYPADITTSISITEQLEQVARQTQLQEHQLKAWSFRAIIYGYQSKFDSMRIISYKGLPIAKKLEDSQILGEYYMHLGVYHESAGILDSAIYYYEEALKTNYSRRINIYANLGKAYNRKGEYVKGIGYLETAITEAQEKGDIHREAVISNNIGIAYHQLGNNERAIAYSKKSIALKEQIGDEIGKLYAISNIADYTTSEEEHRKYVAMGKKIAEAGGNPRHIRYFTAHQATVFLREGKYQEGIDLLLPVYREAVKVPSFEFSKVLSTLSKLYLKMGMLEDAERYSLEGATWAKKSNAPDDLQTAQKNLLNIYQAQKDYQRYFEVATEYYPRRDSINEKLVLNKLAYLDAQLENVAQEQEIKLLNSSLRHKEITRYWIMALALLIAMVLSLILYFRIRQVKAQKETARTLEAMNEKLKELDEAKSHFFTNISHEFRTPLTIISGMAQQIRNDPKQWADKGTQMIERNSRNLLQLVNQILDLRKLESRALEVHYIQGEVIQYLRYITESHQSLANNKGLQLHFLSQPETLVMDYDPDKLLKIVSNLLSNAVKYTPQGGNIYFQLNQKENHEQSFLEMQVKDTGTGIAEDKLAHIFDRFYQVDDSSTRKAGGTGIGLALTQELVKVLEGQIEVSSVPGKGTTFLVRLPISHNAVVDDTKVWRDSSPLVEQMQPLNKPEAVKHSPSSIFETDLPKVLIVEDNEDVQQYLIACLKNTYLLEVANNGQEGIDKAIELIPDLIVSDVMMPEKDGYELCESLKTDERTNHIPIVLLTAKADADSRLSGFEKGADAYLSKPFEPRELLLRLRNLIELQKRIQQQNALIGKDMDNAIDSTSVIEDPFLQKIYELVLQNLSDADYDLSQICRTLGRSRSQVFRKVKALTGHPPSIFIRSIRLHEGKKLLATTDLTIAEIAYDVGFTSPNYFSTAFFEEFGTRPSATRN